MDAASKALCWAKYTLDNFIVKERASRIGKPPKTKIQLLVDSIDLDTLRYIASQHTGECFWDTVQNIFMFADGFRQINAAFAKYLFTNFPKELLNNPSGYIIKKEITGHYKIRHDLNYTKFNYYNNFLANTFRRYILIKLAEKNTPIKDIETVIDEPLVLNNPDITVKPPLGRNPSINLQAGILITQIGDMCLKDDISRVKIVEDMISIPLFKEKFTVISTDLNDANFDKQYKGEKYENNELIAVFMGFSKEEGGGKGHTIGIIRYNNKYFIVDNNNGLAIPINTIDKFNGINFSLIHSNNNFIYKFGKTIIYTHATGIPFTKPETYTQHRASYIYYNPTV